jgi:hypothetical protein
MLTAISNLYNMQTGERDRDREREYGKVQGKGHMLSNCLQFAIDDVFSVSVLNLV